MLDALAALTKTVLYAGLLSGAGAALADVSLQRGSETLFATSRIIQRGAIIAIIAALVGALLLAFRLGGQFDAPTLSAVFLSGSGAAISLQVAGCLLLLSATGSDKAARLTRLPNAMLALLSMAIYGHAATAGGQQAAIALVHVSIAAWWFGSLWILKAACTCLPLAEIGVLVQRFSSQALFLVGTLVLAGAVLLLMLVDVARQPWLSPYGRLFAIKLGWVALVLGLAAYNRFRLTPRLLAGDGTAVTAIRRVIDAELLVIGIVLATTAALVTYTSPPE